MIEFTLSSHYRVDASQGLSWDRNEAIIGLIKFLYFSSQGVCAVYVGVL